MCGRTACTHSPSDIQKKSCYWNNNSGKFEEPEWRDCSNGGRSYTPSSNIAPTDITPVMVSGCQFNSNNRVIMPMLWGLIPSWHKGSYKTHGLSTNNCRVENLKTSKLYKDIDLKGQHCVVLCDGFYEWQTTKEKSKTKQPYFIYMKHIQEEQSKEKTETSKTLSQGTSLLKMAALFNSWVSPEGDEIWSYSILTQEANSSFSSLHHRMPVILDSDSALAEWLEGSSMPQTNPSLAWHPVSTMVNNSRNKDPNCSAALVVEQSTHGGLMRAWLAGNTSKTKKRSAVQSEVNQKKRRTVNNDLRNWLLPATHSTDNPERESAGSLETPSLEDTQNSLEHQ